MDKEKEALFDINFALSDFLLALKNPMFAEENGGIEHLFNDLVEAHEEFEQKFNTVTEPDE